MSETMESLNAVMVPNMLTTDLSATEMDTDCGVVTTAATRKRCLATVEEHNDQERGKPSAKKVKKRAKGNGRPDVDEMCTQDDSGQRSPQVNQMSVLPPPACAYVETVLTDDQENEDARSDSSSTSTSAAKKRKSPAAASSAFQRLLDMEAKAPTCVLGDMESNMFPKRLKFMNHYVDVMYDSRVHVWLKADDVAKALGYKNYKSAVERFVNAAFVRNFHEVLDMSRPRYGDAYRLYPVNSKTQFINEAGLMQLLLRSMISDESVNREDVTEHPQQQAHATPGRPTRHHTKPKLSADWINYQIEPSLIAYSEAARCGQTTRETRVNGV